MYVHGVCVCVQRRKTAPTTSLFKKKFIYFLFNLKITATKCFCCWDFFFATTVVPLFSYPYMKQQFVTAKGCESDLKQFVKRLCLHVFRLIFFFWFYVRQKLNCILPEDTPTKYMYVHKFTDQNQPLQVLFYTKKKTSCLLYDFKIYYNQKRVTHRLNTLKKIYNNLTLNTIIIIIVNLKTYKELKSTQFSFDKTLTHSSHFSSLIIPSFFFSKTIFPP